MSDLAQHFDLIRQARQHPDSSLLHAAAANMVLGHLDQLEEACRAAGLLDAVPNLSAPSGSDLGEGKLEIWIENLLRDRLINDTRVVPVAREIAARVRSTLSSTLTPDGDNG